jgi:hypothetical protein
MLGRVRAARAGGDQAGSRLASVPCGLVRSPARSAISSPSGLVWATRVVWLALAVVGGAAFGEALAEHSRPVQLVGTTGLWIGWAAVAVGLLVPSVRSLTVVRAVVPAGVVVAVLAAVRADSVAAAVVCVALAAVAAALVFSGEFGEHLVQASAYGDERRYLLRPPLGFLVPAVVSWCVLCACAVVGPLALAAEGWVPGVLLTAAALALGWFLGRRFHRLSRRWLVLVPAGVVVHDHLVLADTAMFPVADVARLTLALADTQAADLTGPATGHAVEITLHGMPTVVLAATRATPGGRALHVGAVLVAPTRPGRALRAAGDRTLPVG